VLLGATAVQALLGPSFRLTRQGAMPVSAILRAREPDNLERTCAQLVGDLRAVERMLPGNA
jgi:hypothetical protein